ncbi:helix-turn-helix domain-containing protein [Frigidibacter sp. RF13]|uniref:helix-turn-helix domain-containing protein n=1 Tax=Frigidibacter sp. RF13 TaxID=2997340 RepID=UPI00226F8166|nr:helix-turn-helix domain-containing protein [Frigidibacter sp. RF13]MCY1128613.1 helix-turn-helix domain-containing protein [Frigidibacter sp. RF13]
MTITMQDHSMKDLVIDESGHSFEAVNTPAARVFHVMRTLGRVGATSIVELSFATGLHRSTVWRALDTLRSMGVARKRPGDERYELVGSLVSEFSTYKCARRDEEALQAVFEELLMLDYVYVDLGVFVGLGSFQIVDSSRRDAPIGKDLSLSHEPIALAAQLSLTPEKRARHHSAYASWADPDEKAEITSGRLQGKLGLSIARGKNYVAEPDLNMLAFPVGSHPGAAFAVELWKPSKERFRALSHAIDSISALLN